MNFIKRFVEVFCLIPVTMLATMSWACNVSAFAVPPPEENLSMGAGAWSVPNTKLMTTGDYDGDLLYETAAFMTTVTIIWMFGLLKIIIRQHL